MKIGEYIRQFREQKKWLQKFLAAESSVEKTKLSKIEKYSQMPYFDEACRICEALGITPNTMWQIIKTDYPGYKTLQDEGALGEEGGKEENSA